MEHYKAQPYEERSRKNVDESSFSALHPERRMFAQDGQLYEENSLLAEPIEKYEEDLGIIDRAIEKKKRELYELQLQARASEIDTGIVEKIAFVTDELDRFATLRRMTVERLSLMKLQDYHEKKSLNKLSTDGIEN